LRFYNTVEQAWEEQRRLNQPAEEYDKLKAHFTTDLDETSVLGNEGTAKVVGAAAKKKHEKNMDDCRESITIACGLAVLASTVGPGFFLLPERKWNMIR
jgi:hypothetical protein